MSGARLALKCSGSGRVLEVIRDDLNVVPETDAAVLLPALCTGDGSIRCFQMLDEVRTEDAIFGWLIELSAPSGPTTLHFAGVHANDETLFVATEDIEEITPFADELMRVNNEHVNTLRELVKERSSQSGTDALNSQMSDLNNANTMLQRDLAHQRAELEALLAWKNELFGMLAHDLRNPLAAAEILTKFVHEEVTEDAGLITIVEELQLCTSMASSLVDGVLDLAAVEAGTLTLELSPCDMASIAERAIGVERPLAERAGVSITMDASARCGLTGDELKLRRLLGNLIGNAVKHSPSGGTVQVLVDCTADDDCVVSVVDEGDGFPEELHDVLFEPFQKGSQSDGGVGLGLAIAHRIAQGHGGTLVAINEPGKGARIELRLPAVQLV
jgi:signal transduction histidine kinase